MGSAIFKMIAKKGEERITTNVDSLFKLQFNTITGQPVDFSQFANKKAILVVNVASEDQGLEILAFPCNQFKKQEPLPNDKILDYVHSKFKVATDYPFFEKSDVNGPKTNSVYCFLRSTSELYNPKTKGSQVIPWNFAKFLVNSEGKVIKFYQPPVSPLEIVPDIKPLL